MRNQGPFSMSLLPTCSVDPYSISQIVPCSVHAHELVPGELMRQPNSLGAIFFEEHIYNVYFRCRRPSIDNTTKCAPVSLYTVAEVLNWTSDIEVTLTDLLAEHRLVLAGDFGRPGDASGLRKRKRPGRLSQMPYRCKFSLFNVNIFYIGDVFT